MLGMELCKNYQVAALSPVQWLPYALEPMVELLDTIKGRLSLLCKKALVAFVWRKAWKLCTSAS